MVNTRNASLRTSGTRSDATPNNADAVEIAAAFFKKPSRQAGARRNRNKNNISSDSARLYPQLKKLVKKNSAETRMLNRM